jgi:hypothetical protein
MDSGIGVRGGTIMTSDSKDGLVLIGVILVLYFLPAIIATLRRHAGLAGIWALNIFGGWTVIGWIVAFVWAFTSPSTVVVVQNQPAPAAAAVPPAKAVAPPPSSSDSASPRPTKECVECAELIQQNARKCRFCGATQPTTS